MSSQDSTNLLILVVILALLVFSIKRDESFGNCKNFDTNLGPAELQKYYDEMNKYTHYEMNKYTHEGVSAPAPELN